MGGEGWYVLKTAMGTKQTSPLSDRSSKEHSDDPACCVRIDMAAVLGDGVLCGTSLQGCVSRHSKDNGSYLTLKRGTTILMPVLQMSCFFKQIVNKIVAILRVQDTAKQCLQLLVYEA
jgi:hypothetical protein